MSNPKDWPMVEPPPGTVPTCGSCGHQEDVTIKGEAYWDETESRWVFCDIFDDGLNCPECGNTNNYFTFEPKK